MKGFSYKEIRCLLVKEHDILISERNFKCQIKELGLSRKKNFTDDHGVEKEGESTRKIIEGFYRDYSI